MKIQCSKCKKLYNIKSENIPKNGAYTKCKNCGSKIFVKKCTKNLTVNTDIEIEKFENKKNESSQTLVTTEKSMEEKNIDSNNNTIKKNDKKEKNFLLKKDTDELVMGIVTNSSFNEQIESKRHKQNISNVSNNNDSDFKRRNKMKNSLDLQEIRDKYKELHMNCAYCDNRESFNVPVDLTNKRCSNCNKVLDPIQWDNDSPVNHKLMHRLISICYKNPEVAYKIINLYKRNYNYAKIEEWGIDKSLLIIHAANSIVQRGHRSLELFLLIIMSFSFKIGSIFIPPIGAIVPLYIISTKREKNYDFLKKYLNIESYNPTQVPESNTKNIMKIIKYNENTQPENLYFFSASYNPFHQFGSNAKTWSFLVDRRKKTGGAITKKPTELNLDTVYDKIIDRLCKMSGPGTTNNRFHVKDVFLADANRIDVDEKDFFELNEDMYYPKNRLEINPKDADKYIDACRCYKMVSFYDPQRDICIRSFFRLQHQGPFTFIESIGTQLLPLANKIFQNYTELFTSEELDMIDAGPGLYSSLEVKTKRKISFVSVSFIGILIVWLLGTNILGDNGVLISNIPHLILLLIIIFSTFGFINKYDDIHEPKKDIPFPFSLIAPFIFINPKKETNRRKERKKIKHKQQAKEYNFSPNDWSLRHGQSRSDYINYFESVDIDLIRKTQELIIQEAFIECLEDVGIDTSEFKEGLSQVNNYGIINSGKISGSAKIDTAQGRQHKNKKKFAENPNKTLTTQKPNNTI